MRTRCGLRNPLWLSHLWRVLRFFALSDGKVTGLFSEVRAGGRGRDSTHSTDNSEEPFWWFSLLRPGDGSIWMARTHNLTGQPLQAREGA